MTSTREHVLEHLLNRQRCTINELAEAVNINPISVRHHITKLEAEGLVDSEEERHGVGRPRRVYFLTHAGMEIFPSRYLSLSSRLLEQIKDYLPVETTAKLLEQMATDLTEDYVAEIDLQALTFEERVELAKQMLNNEGFTVEVEQHGKEYHIKELSCPYYHVGQEHHEVCNIDKTIISQVLSLPPERTRCILDGDAHCTYVVPIIPMSNIEVSESAA